MPNWGITQFAIANIGAIAVPVLPGFCSTELQNILEHAEVKVIFVSRLLAKCLEGVKTPFLEHKILINNFILSVRKLLTERIVVISSVRII